MKKIAKYITLSILIFTTVSCSKLEDFGDTNDNPSATTNPILAAILTNVEAQLGSYASQTRSGLYGQYFSETQYTDVSLYSIPQLAFTGNYSGTLNDLQNIIDKNESNNMTQVAIILQQYIFWTLTDQWGDLPYSEALKGNSNPIYDTQEDIYKGMIAKLKTAVSSFDSSMISGDVIFSGDVASWKRTANSMRMLMAIQLSAKLPSSSGYAALQFKDALADGAGYIDANSQNFKVSYPGGNYKSNWWNLYDGRKDYAESKTLTDLMGTLGDTRQNAFGGVTQDQGVSNSNVTSSFGVPYGLARAKAEVFTSANTGWARILRGDFRTESSSVMIISAAEVAMARAEAADLGWTTEILSSVYSVGITLSFEQWGLSLPSNYLTKTDVQLTTAGTGANKKQIAIQNYIASYPDGLRAWNIWRKTGYPVLTPAPDATNSSKQIPTRYVYASSEYTTNEVNVKEAVARLTGGDSQDSKIWWDQ